MTTDLHDEHWQNRELEVDDHVAAGRIRAESDREANPTRGPSTSAPTRTATLSHASARPFRPTGNDSVEVILGVEILRSDVAPEQCFQAAERDPCAFKRWVYRPIVAPKGAG